MYKNFYRFSFLSVVLSVIVALTVTVAPAYGQSVSVEKDGYIKWVDFNVTYNALSECLKYDIDTYGKKEHASWIDLLAILSARGGGNFKNYK